MAKRYCNWIDVAATIVGVMTPVAIKSVRDVALQRGAQILKGRGDADLFPTSVRMTGGEPVLRITTEDESLAGTLYPGVKCSSVVATHLLDENEVAGGAGDLIYAMTNCRVGGGDQTGGYGAWGSLTLEFHGRSTDGVTSPIAITVDT